MELMKYQIHVKIMNNLKIITTLPDVYSINFNISSSPNLNTLNIFGGLQVLTLYNTSNVNNKLRFLIVPDSVKECVLTNLSFDEIIFDCGNTETLILKINGCTIHNSLTCKALLSSDSFIKNTYSGDRILPVCLNVSHNVLSKIDSSVFLNNYHILNMFIPINYDSNIHPVLPYSMTFKVIFNYTPVASSQYEFYNLHTSNWF